VLDGRTWKLECTSVLWFLCRHHHSDPFIHRHLPSCPSISPFLSHVRVVAWMDIQYKLLPSFFQPTCYGACGESYAQNLLAGPCLCSSKRPSFACLDVDLHIRWFFGDLIGRQQRTIIRWRWLAEQKRNLKNQNKMSLYAMQERIQMHHKPQIY
jgi:hypothetical protein